MKEKTEQILKAVLQKITPKSGKRAKIRALTKKLERRVRSAAEKSGVVAKVRVEGSVAKDTWLNEEPDIDVFMRVSATVPRRSLGEVGLAVAREATAGSLQVERFAEHPYLESFVEGVRVNVVPCYDVERGNWLSATDRTPFHTDYVNKHLDGSLRDEVRLLKKFMKGIGVYGAEIKVGGFSGYLCELIILNYKGFVNALKAFAEGKQRMVVDIEDYYENRKRDLQLMFSEPLVVVDPVDKGRNVASAVQSQKLDVFVAASQVFLKNPSMSFFDPRATIALSNEQLKRNLANRGSTLVFVVFEKADVVPDVLWGQLYKSQRSLRRLLELNDFKVLRDTAWSNERKTNLFVFELEQPVLASAKKHLGPPLDKKHECERFLGKYVGNSDVVSGPYIEGGRWVVEVRRKYMDVVKLLTDKLKDGGRNAGVAEQISQKIRKGFKVLINEDIVGLHAKNGEVARFLTEFLSGKPKWLENS
jgi:tRNA nucleotidyltransferase (CCA-adding enzyme)